MSKHRGEPKEEIFKPGDRVRFKKTEQFTPTYVIVVLFGGYVIEGDWHFAVKPSPFTSQEFEKVGRR